MIGEGDERTSRCGEREMADRRSSRRRRSKEGKEEGREETGIRAWESVLPRLLLPW